jgi:hypothetical protein
LPFLAPPNRGKPSPDRAEDLRFAATLLPLVAIVAASVPVACWLASGPVGFFLVVGSTQFCCMVAGVAVVLERNRPEADE